MKIKCLKDCKDKILRYIDIRNERKNIGIVSPEYHLLSKEMNHIAEYLNSSICTENHSNLIGKIEKKQYESYILSLPFAVFNDGSEDLFMCYECESGFPFSEIGKKFGKTCRSCEIPSFEIKKRDKIEKSRERNNIYELYDYPITDHLGKIKFKNYKDYLYEKSIRS